MPIGFDEVRAYLLSLPGVEEGPCYGTPGFRVRGKLIARLKEDRDSLVVRLSFDEREMLMEADPDAFYITDHYRAWPSVLVRLSKVEPGTLKRLLLQYWREVAPKKLVAGFEQG